MNILFKSNLLLNVFIAITLFAIPASAGTDEPNTAAPPPAFGQLNIATPTDDGTGDAPPPPASFGTLNSAPADDGTGDAPPPPASFGTLNSAPADDGTGDTLPPQSISDALGDGTDESFTLPVFGGFSNDDLATLTPEDSLYALFGLDDSPIDDGTGDGTGDGTFQNQETECLNAMQQCQATCDPSGDFAACITTTQSCQLMNSPTCTGFLNAPPPAADK